LRMARALRLSVDVDSDACLIVSLFVEEQSNEISSY